MHKHFYFYIIFLPLFLATEITLSKTSSETKEFYQLSPEIKSQETNLKSKKITAKKMHMGI